MIELSIHVREVKCHMSRQCMDYSSMINKLVLSVSRCDCTRIIDILILVEVVNVFKGDHFIIMRYLLGRFTGKPSVFAILYGCRCTECILLILHQGLKPAIPYHVTLLIYVQWRPLDRNNLTLMYTPALSDV